MHWLLFYETAPDYLEKRAAHRSEHLGLAHAAADRGHLILGGALDGPDGGAVLLFEGSTSETAEAFAAADPYVRNGLVTRWWVRRWITVAGEDAARPTPA